MTPMARTPKRVPSRWEEDNEAPLNPAVFVVFGLLGLAVAGLFLLFVYVI